MLERVVGHLLQRRIERGRDREAAFVQRLRAVLALEILSDLLDEERRDRLAAASADRRSDDRRLVRGLGLLLRDVALVGHALQHVPAASLCRVHVDERTLARRRLNDAGEERRFLERQLLVRLAEIQPRRRLDAVRAVAEQHLVGVEREDLALRVALLDLDGDDRFLDLSFEADVADAKADRFGEEIARQLLGERAGAGRCSRGA